MPILVDYSQVILSATHVYNGPELQKGADPKEVSGMLKHMFFNSILSYVKKFKATYGDLIITCDSRANYWRRDYFPAYKGHRKHDRKESNLDWDAIYKAVEEIKQDLRDNFPYKVVETIGAEADDVMAVLTKYFQENEFKSVGLFDDEPQPVLIISSDTDLYQLQQYKNVKQWSPMFKKMAQPGYPASEYLTQHIVEGDAGDNIPNLLTQDQWANDRAAGVKPARQKSIMSVRLKEFMNLGIEACKTDEEKRNWQRNLTLVSFDKIPQNITDSVIDTYKKAETKASKGKLLNYFMKNRMKLMINEVNSFF